MSGKVNLLASLVLTAACCSGQSLPQKPEYAQYNPGYHFYPSGDPTGLFYLGGSYYDNWGAASSADLVHWNYHATIPRPGGSGTVVVDWNNTSGLGKAGRPPLISFWHNGISPWGNQVIGLAYSNDTAKTWTRYEKFPVLDINSKEFRDPKVFWYEPEKSWIMAIGAADAPKVKFFSSPNLKDWTFMSEFGPWGAVGGVWECADFFPLPVDGDAAKLKWVLVISVQPLSSQYFIGDFDGRRFILDPSFVQQLSADTYMPQGSVLFDFEKGTDEWKTEGEAFSESPSNHALLGQGAAMGYCGRFYLNSFHDRGKSTGQQTSPPFRITKKYINFLAGGDYNPEMLAIHLLVDGRIVRTQYGNNSGGLQWTSWEVAEFAGKMASIEVIDNGRGGILADQFMSGDQPAKQDRENAFWIDDGADFYAVRSWNNYPNGENRRIWTGWMGSWRYAGVEPVRGLQTIPRTVALTTFPEGIRLVQAPIKELESLRSVEKNGGATTFEGIWRPGKIKPGKNRYELITEIENLSAEEFGIKLAVGNGQQTVIGYSAASGELYLDRRRSGLIAFSGLFPQVNHGRLAIRNNTLKLHLFVDNCSVEVFANDGEKVISSKIYPDAGSTGIEFFSTQGQVHVKSVRLWELQSIGLKQTR